jgi:exopolysaccharide biosynthesis polyprenyl glycosylphosphotransferase
MSQPAPAVEAIRRDDGAVSRPRDAAALPAHAAVAAGGDDRIPRIFLGAADVVILGSTFVIAKSVAPLLHLALLPGGALYPLLPAIFPIPSAPTPTEEFPALSEWVWLLVATVPATLIVMELVGGYRRSLAQSLPRVVANAILSQVVAISFASLLLLAFRLSSSSRIVIFTYALLAALGLVAYRGTIWTYQHRRQKRGVYAKNVLLVGQPRSVEWMVRHFRRNVQDTQFRLSGWLSVQVEHSHAPERRKHDSARDIPIERLGRVEDLGALLVHHPVHEIIAIQSSVDRDWLRQVIDHCDYFRIRVRIVPEALLVRRVGDLELAFRDDPLRLPEVVLSPRNLDSDMLFVKRAIDVVVSALLLTLLSPLFLLIAAAIKLTTPELSVFYPWRVIGLNGRPFTGYKFTTMVADADAQKPGLMSQNEMQGPVFKIRTDPRITGLGQFLRKYSLNELPQLWSVLKGDMSLVGPRPAFRHELERYELWHKRKLTFKPGITCLWQVSGRNRISNFDEWVRLDLEYIDRWSLGLDIRILARTFRAVFSGSGS